MEYNALTFNHGVMQMQLVGFLIFFGLGLLQIAATISGLEAWLGLPWIVAVVAAVFFAWMPLIGTVVGMFGAVTVWGWSWLAAIGLFFGPLIVMAAITVLMGGYETLLSRRKATSPPPA